MIHQMYRYASLGARQFVFELRDRGSMPASSRPASRRHALRDVLEMIKDFRMRQSTVTATKPFREALAAYGQRDDSKLL